MMMEIGRTTDTRFVLLCRRVALSHAVLFRRVGSVCCALH
jgi:hypothetical protein